MKKTSRVLPRFLAIAATVSISAAALADPPSLSDAKVRSYGQALRRDTALRRSPRCNRDGSFLGTGNAIAAAATDLAGAIPAVGNALPRFTSAAREVAPALQMTTSDLAPDSLSTEAGSLFSAKGPLESHAHDPAALGADIASIESVLPRIAGRAQTMLTDVTSRWSEFTGSERICDDPANDSQDCAPPARLNARGAAGALSGAASAVSQKLARLKVALDCKRADDEITFISGELLRAAPPEGDTELLSGDLARPVIIGDRACTTVGQIEENLGAILHLTDDGLRAITREQGETQYPLYVRRAVAEMTADYVNSVRKRGKNSRRELTDAERRELNAMIGDFLAHYRRYEASWARLAPGAPERALNRRG